MCFFVSTLIKRRMSQPAVAGDLLLLRRLTDQRCPHVRLRIIFILKHLGQYIRSLVEMAERDTGDDVTGCDKRAGS